jgi:hypothetical protein
MNNMNRKFLIALLLILVACAIGIGHLVFTSEGYHRLFRCHHFKLTGSCMVYSMETGDFLPDTILEIEECQSSKDGAMVRQGTFVIKDYLDIATFAKTEEENAFFADAAYYQETSGMPGLRYVITKYQSIDGRTPAPVRSSCYPEAILQYDTADKRAVITLSYDENGGDVRYLVLYGFYGQQEALNYCRHQGMFSE